MEAPSTRVVSVGTALPGPAVDNAALARHFGAGDVWEQWVESFIGTTHRHLATDLETGRTVQSLEDLARRAGQRALDAAGVGPGDIDLVVMGTATPDKLMPPTATMVAGALGIDGVPAFQLQSGCTGAVQALAVAASFLETGSARRALVLGGDVCTRIIDPRVELNSLPPEEMINLVLFGDGAGAAVLESGPDGGPYALRRVLTRLEGGGREPGQCLNWFTRTGSRDEPAVTEDYKAIEASVPLMAAEMCKELLDDLGWTADDVAWLLPPQLSGRMTQKIVDHLGLTGAEAVNCVAQTGNTSNALPFLQLERLFGRMQPGSRALGMAIESSKWIKGGYALEYLR